MQVMRSISSTWFEAKVKFDKVQEDGNEKTVTESYAVDAMSFTEAEARIVDEMSAYTSGELFIKSIARAPYSEVYFSDKDSDDKYYRAKVAFLSVDENTDKEKRTIFVYLVQAASLDKAREYVKEAVNGSIADSEVVSISETTLLDVFEHK